MNRAASVKIIVFFAFSSTFTTIQADQTGDCTAGDEFCEQNSLVTTNTTTTTNTNTNNYVAYVFSEVTGYSKFGSYTGNGSSSDGTFVFLGFRPALVILKNTNTVKHWGLFDNKRIGFNVENYALFPSDTSADDTSDYIDFLSNGFKLRSTALFLNKSGDEFIYLAFAESPFKNSRAR